ncbi:hypothetical protein B0T22DRAFT_138799 [Podospora appendiculata]|uniref:CCHC-type domain-containing protein n=1 Tax=Podospora appendiculata TaxID=314037 RepID=A0AAE0X8F0_9PEZI|nr:hypothetical protein B0T22DRAFT_138799 [Podospora appendiculata]
MSATAPGQNSVQEEPVCYNCGVKGHWVVACPEPTRKTPVGLLKQWQHKNQKQSGDRNYSSHDKKGPVVTRYPQPPGQAPPNTAYGPPQPASYPPGAIPPPPLPYSQPGYPPPPSLAGLYPPPPPPPQTYGQYQPPAPPPAPLHYGQQPPYPQHQYPQQYPPLPPVFYQSNGLPPPPPFPQGNYPPQQYAPPPLQPPPPPVVPGHYPHQYPAGLPPPPHDFHGPPGQPLYPIPPPAAAGYPPPPGWIQPGYGPPPPGLPAPHQSHNNNHRGKNQKNQGSKRSNSHKDRHRSGNDLGGKNGSGRGERRQERRATQDELPSKPATNKAKVAETKEDAADGEWNPYSEEDLKHIFPEIEVKPGDPVGIPLPCVYNDDPTIPPAYNATCIKSAFFDERNGAEFARSIREAPDWSMHKLDPVFKQYSSMIVSRFEPSEHDYFTYRPSTPPSPTATLKMPPRYRIDRAVRHETPGNKPTQSDEQLYSSSKILQPRDSRYDQDNRWRPRPTKRSYDNTPERKERDERDSKRARQTQSQHSSPLDDYDGAASPVRRSTPSPKFQLDGDPWSPKAGESSIKVAGDARYLDIQSDSKRSSSREERVVYAKMRHDSGYHSGQSQDRVKASDRNNERNGRSSHRSQQRRKSRSRSRSPVSSFGRSESPLTALDYELLGMAEEEPSEPKPKVTPKKPTRRVHIAAAFSRRW